MPLSPMEVLKKVPLFSGLGEADLTAFADLTRERSYPKGSVIVFEDDAGDGMGCGHAVRRVGQHVDFAGENRRVGGFS